jgi:macrophage erythroblast attacher
LPHNTPPNLLQSNLEFLLRFQQYVELVRTQTTEKLVEAITHAKKYLIPYKDTYPREVHQAAGLLAFPPDRIDKENSPSNGWSAGVLQSLSYPYKSLYSPTRWSELADLFVRTHNNLLALPSSPLLHIALSSGLSALKTPACHGSHSTAKGSSVCPICSTELNELARAVPYAHHSKSHVEHDLLLLPNGRVYGKVRLEEHASKSGVPEGLVKDLVTGDMFPFKGLKKVFIT